MEFVWRLSQLAFYFCDKHQDQKQLGEERGMFQFTFPHCSQSI